jgi:hypothetical protein
MTNIFAELEVNPFEDDVVTSHGGFRFQSKVSTTSRLSS